MLHECLTVGESAPAHLIRHARQLLTEIAAVLAGNPLCRQAAERVRLRYPHHAAQIDAGSRLLAADPLDLTMANLSYDLFLGLFGCSTMVLAGEAGPVVARNMDWLMPDRIARASCIVPLENGLHAGAIGSTGIITGLSRHGYAVILNAVRTGEIHREGYPVLLFLRHLLDTARSFDEAVGLASDTPLASAALITLAGTRNSQRVCVERTPRRHRQRWPHGDEPLLVTNHFRSLAGPEFCPRYDFLARRLRHQPRPTLDDMLDLLTHGSVRQTITAQHILACPATGTFRLFVPAELLETDWRGEGLAGLRQLF